MHDTPCETLKKCKDETTDRLTRIEESLEYMVGDIKATREIVEIFNDTKGFVTTVRTMSKILIWFTVTGAAITAVYQSIKHWG